MLQVSIQAEAEREWKRIQRRNATPEPTRTNSTIALRPLSEIVAEQREPQWLLRNIIEAMVLAVLAGPRGSFKSFVALDWAMRMALAGHGVVILSGEGAGIDRRAAAWLQQHAPDRDIASLPIVVLERPVNLNNAQVRSMVAKAVKALPWKPAMIVIDTLSKFAPGLDENDNSEAAGFLSALAIDLRDELTCTVLLVAHSGHGDAKRPRGASVLMANPDAEYMVSRPDPKGMRVTVSRERFKDTASLPPLAYTARVVDLGRRDKYGDPVTSLVLDSTEPSLIQASRATLRPNQEKAVAALKEWCRANPNASHITTIALQAVLKSQGLSDRRRRPEVIDWLYGQRILTPAIGGFTVDAKALQ